MSRPSKALPRPFSKGEAAFDKVDAPFAQEHAKRLFEGKSLLVAAAGRPEGF